MKLAVIGSRDVNDYNLVKTYLDKTHSIKPISTIVSGGAKGADKLGEKWANENFIYKSIFYPNWSRYGKKAGFIRNEKIIKEAEYVIAFWNGTSKGTKHSIDLAKKLGKKCKIVYTDKTFLRKKKIEKILERHKPKRPSLF